MNSEDSRSFIARWRAGVLSDKGPPKPSTKLVLAVLAEYADPDGSDCFPSVASVCKHTGLSKRSVIEHLKEAKRLGWLSVHSRGKSVDGWRRNRYQPLLPDAMSAKGYKSAPSRAISANNDKQKVQISTAKSAKSKPDLDHDLDHDLDRAAQGGRRRSRATQLPKSFEPDNTCQAKAREIGVDLQLELEKFTNHAQANGRTAKDWQAAFRNWLIKAREFDRTRPPAGRESQRRVSPSDHVLSSYD